MSKGAALAVALVVGIPLALFTAMLALGMAGGGHGWITPMWISFGGLAGFPVGIYALLAGRSVSGTFCGGMAAIGLFTDFAAVLLTFNEGTHYFDRTWPYNLIWVALWASWQVPLLWRAIASTGEADL